MNKPLRLLRVALVPDNRHGGMSRTMHATGDHLATMGFEVDYLFQEAFGDRTSARWRRFTGSWETANLVRQHAAERGDYDIVEVHEPLALGPGLLRSFSLGRAKLAAFSYGLEKRGWPILLDYGRRHGVTLPLKSRFTGWLQARQSALGLRFCDSVVCSNQQDVDYLRSQGFAPERLKLHHSGVEDELLAAGADTAGNLRRDILFLGSWLDRKGVRDLVPAIIPVLRENPAVRFTIAGCQSGMDDIQAQFPEDVRSAVQIIPKITSDAQLSEVYAANGIFVLPSYFEGQPLVMMEAAAFGMAIVTTPVCGMLDFIRDGENGLFAPVGDAPALEKKLRELVASPDLALKLGTQARADVARYTWRASAEQLAGSYRALAGRA